MGIAHRGGTNLLYVPPKIGKVQNQNEKVLAFSLRRRAAVTREAAPQNSMPSAFTIVTESRAAQRRRKVAERLAAGLAPRGRKKSSSWDIVRRVTSTYADVFAQL